MKRYLILLLLCGAAMAQTAGSSFGFDIANGTCPTPKAGMDFLCGSASGFTASVNGAAYGSFGGASPSIAIGVVTTNPPGSLATVQNVGSAVNAVFNFGIPAGNPGPQGLKGDKGDKGDPGTTWTSCAVTLTANSKGQLVITLIQPCNQ